MAWSYRRITYNSNIDGVVIPKLSSFDSVLSLPIRIFKS